MPRPMAPRLYSPMPMVCPMPMATASNRVWRRMRSRLGRSNRRLCSSRCVKSSRRQNSSRRRPDSCHNDSSSQLKLLPLMLGKRSCSGSTAVCARRQMLQDLLPEQAALTARTASGKRAAGPLGTAAPIPGHRQSVASQRPRPAACGRLMRPLSRRAPSDGPLEDRQSHRAPSDSPLENRRSHRAPADGPLENQQSPRAPSGGPPAKPQVGTRAGGRCRAAPDISQAALRQCGGPAPAAAALHQ